MKKAMVTLESSVEASAKIRFIIEGLVRENCSIEFNSWKMVHVDLKNFMVQETRKAMTSTPRPTTTHTTAATAPAKMDHRPVNPVDPVAKKNTRGPCRQLKMAKVTQVTNSRITIEYDERHQACHADLLPMRWKSWKAMLEEVKNTQWNSDLHQYFEEGCPNEFEDRQDSWVWLCSHFQELGYVVCF
ncbi:hypothetical protein D8674_041049 [Pyrus ussuriensis x Pyrus communis]|uniref:Uncharacterized protein n=1 Tax=Pyrus ussuriensis x Pyrus communis TaxID=2448454 RepID=A0A5N5FHC3_9ROSA|nr:hypothetical protein D8674_041049 [Pyrus ussuriensis x Pyrus communis]